MPDSYGADSSEKFNKMEELMSGLAPGSSGLLALDWNMGTEQC